MRLLLRPTLRSLTLASVLSHSLNTVYTVRYAHANCAFGTTSHTPKPLSEMPKPVLRKESFYVNKEVIELWQQN